MDLEFRVTVFVLSLMISGSVWPGVQFRCYHTPSQLVQAFQYGSAACGVKGNSAAVDQEGKKQVLCIYQAVCEPADKNTPTLSDIPSIQMRFNQGLLKQSILVCEGPGTVKGGRLDRVECLSPEKCQKDVFYDFLPAGFAPPSPTTTLVPAQNAEGLPQ